MKKRINIKKNYKRIFFIVIFIYVACIFINQQKTLNAYKANQEYYAAQIKQETEYKETLIAMKDNINSPEYIEKIAREKYMSYIINKKLIFILVYNY